LSESLEQFRVAVVATPDGKFTFQIFLEIGAERYATPADAAQAGYASIAAKRL
jgi:hypothetical protein